MSSEQPIFPGKRVTGDKNLLYGALHPFALPGWMSPNLIQLKGANWQVIFKLDGADYIDMERGVGVVERHLEGPNVLIAGIDGLSDAAEVTKAQKPIVDAIRGLLLLAAPPAKTILLPAVWEGVMRKTSPETIGFEVHRPEVTALEVTPGQLHDWGNRWNTFDPTGARSELGFALRWYYKGMIDLHDTGDRIDAFVSLWLCIVTLVRAWHAQNVGGDPPELVRFIAYAQQRLLLTESDFDDVKDQFIVVRDRRNELFKGGGGMEVSEEELNAVAHLSHQILDHETAASA